MSTSQHIKVLAIAEDQVDYQRIKDLLVLMEGFAYKVDWESNAEQADAVLKRHRYDIYLLSDTIARKNHWATLKKATEGQFKPIIVFSKEEHKNHDLKSMQYGASDFVVLSTIRPAQLERTIRYTINHAKTVREDRENQQRYKDLFEKSIDPLILVERDLKIKDVNPAMMQMMGGTADELYGQSFLGLFAEAKISDRFNNRLLKNKQLKDFEAVLVDKACNKHVCVINFVGLYTNEGRLTGYQGILHDISKRKKAEEDLVEAEKLSMTGLIARSIAHEVRNPLTNIQLALEQLEEDPDADDLALYYDIIRRNSGRIDFLISELMNSSKPKEINPVLADFQEIVENTLELVKDRIRLKNMTLETDFKVKEPRFHFDGELLKTAFLNILINAIEAMDENKGILRVSLNEKGQKVILIISDNGKGIKKSELKKLFDPFYTGKKKGMGLGLTTTKNIIHSHKGKIEVESDPATGTYFTITFSKKNDLKPSI